MKNRLQRFLLGLQFERLWAITPYELAADFDSPAGDSTVVIAAKRINGIVYACRVLPFGGCAQQTKAVAKKVFVEGEVEKAKKAREQARRKEAR